MSLERSIPENLPTPVPTSEITVSDEFTITAHDGDPQTVYSLSKSPYRQLRSVRGVVNGVERELDIGTDVIPYDDNSDSNADAVRFAGTIPDVGTVVTVEYDILPLVARYAMAYDDDIDTVGSDIDTAIDNKFVKTAEDGALSLLGAQFGYLGRRSQRSDSEYRTYLQSIVTSFTANGTQFDLKLAVSAATGVPVSELTVTEFTDTQEAVVVIVGDRELTVSEQLSDIIDETLVPGVRARYDLVSRNGSLVLTLDFEGYQTAGVSVGLGASSLGTETLGSVAGYQVFPSLQYPSVSDVGLPIVAFETDATIVDGLGSVALGSATVGSSRGYQSVDAFLYRSISDVPVSFISTDTAVIAVGGLGTASLGSTALGDLGGVQSVRPDMWT